MTAAERDDLPAITPRIARLPVDHRGYPVPWFVAWIDGKPDFRVMDGEKFVRAIKDRLCWVCGQPLGRYATFVVGPMCGVNRVSAEPPSHNDCAHWSAKACPFLSDPSKRRGEQHLPSGTVDPAGEFIRRNPGVTLLWTVSRGSYRPFRVGDGYLLTFDDPESMEWVACGRAATTDEIEASIASGLPALEASCESDDDRAALARQVEQLHRLVPS